MLALMLPYVGRLMVYAMWLASGIGAALAINSALYVFVWRPLRGLHKKTTWPHWMVGSQGYIP